MKKLGAFVVIAVIIAMCFISCKNGSVSIEEADHLAWCEEIYHQNVGCPKHGQVKIPPSVIKKQEADHLAWCEEIYHQNVGCPDFK